MWFLYAILAGLFFAGNRLLVRSILTKNTDPLGFLAPHDLLAGLVLLPLVLFNFSAPQTISDWLLVGAASAAFFVRDLFAFKALKTVEASVFQIIGQLRHIVVLAGAYLFLAETISVAKLSAVGLIILGVYIAVSEKTSLKLNAGTVYAIISALAIGTALLIMKPVLNHGSAVLLASIQLVLPGLYAFGLLLAKKNIGQRLLPRIHRKHLVIAAVIFAIFEVFQLSALNSGEASKVVPVLQSAMIFSLLGGYLFLGERTRLFQKICGCLVVTMGIVLLYFV